MHDEGDGLILESGTHKGYDAHILVVHTKFVCLPYMYLCSFSVIALMLASLILPR
jgi:hypothetical protein